MLLKLKIVSASAFLFNEVKNNVIILFTIAKKYKKFGNIFAKLGSRGLS